MKAIVSNHPAKMATAVGGGFSLGIAFMMFVSKGEFTQHCSNCAETHRQVQDIDSKLDRVQMFIARQGFVTTNALDGGFSAEPYKGGQAEILAEPYTGEPAAPLSL